MINLLTHSPGHLEHDKVSIVGYKTCNQGRVNRHISVKKSERRAKRVME